MTDRLPIKPRQPNFSIRTGLARPEIRWKRPKNLILTANPKEGKVEYIRNAKNALAFTSGLNFEVKGALSLLIDMFMVHEKEGIPANPPSYAAGNLGLGEKKWTATVLPMLIKTKRIRKVNRDGIEYLVLADGMFGAGDKAVARELDRNMQARVFAPRSLQDRIDDMRKDNLGKPQIVPLCDVPGEVTFVPTVAERMQVEVDPQTPREFLAGSNPMLNTLRDSGRLRDADDVAFPVEEPSETPAAKTDAYRYVFEGGPAPSLPVEKINTPAPEAVPLPSAHMILERAGYPTNTHRQGEHFWHRLEHGDVIKGWIAKGITVNQIVSRIAKAVQIDKAPKEPNGMVAFESIVLGGEA